MFEFNGSPVPVRQDLKGAYVEIWKHLAGPGPTLTGHQRVDVAAHVRAARGGGSPIQLRFPDTVVDLAVRLFVDPATIDGSTVRAAATDIGDATTVEVISVVSMLAAVDGAHRGLKAELEPLPTPLTGEPTAVTTEGLKRRRTHVPMPAGAIPFALDLLPEVGQVFRNSSGPQYMTGAEMEHDDFARNPGLNRAQMEIVSSRTSMHNRCFY